MFFAKSDYIFFTYEWFAACHKISMDTKFLALCYNAVQILVCKIIFVAVFCSPAACAMHIAGTCGVHKYYPGNIAVIFFAHFLTCSESMESCFISKCHKSLFKNKRVYFFNKSLSKMNPFTVFTRKSCS